MWKIWWAPNNASKWQMGFNSAFKWLTRQELCNKLILQVYNNFQNSLYVWFTCWCFVCIPPWLKSAGLHNVCYSGVNLVLDRIYVGAGGSLITGRIWQTKHIKILLEPRFYHRIYHFLLSPFFMDSAFNKPRDILINKTNQREHFHNTVNLFSQAMTPVLCTFNWHASLIGNKHHLLF
jgi:hypothetical protein